MSQGIKLILCAIDEERLENLENVEGDKTFIIEDINRSMLENPEKIEGTKLRW